MSDISAAQNSISGHYCDGLSARYVAVQLRLDGHMLHVVLPDQQPLLFSLSNLSLVAPYRRGKALALKANTASDKMRIVVEDQKLAEAIAGLKPDFQLVSTRPERRGNRLKIAVALILIFASFAWLAQTALPQYLVLVVPNTWRQAAGASQEEDFAAFGKRCHGSAADAAMVAMLKVLAAGDADMPAVEVHIYDLSFVNAFALAGGRIIMSQKLIDEATRPDEVAGVLAHEIGHVVHADPETQLIRNFGLQVFFDALGSSKTAGTAGMMEQFRQSREAEENADAYARKLMAAAHVDPTGLKDMFSRLLKRENTNKVAVLDAWGSMFATHPGTESRITKIVPLPNGVQPKQVLNDADWQALRKGCS